MQENYIRKVFFLNPPLVVRDLYPEIVKQGYEAYLLDDPDFAVELVTKYRGSILYVNIDQKRREGDWLSYIGTLRTSPATADTQIGVFTGSRSEKAHEARDYILGVGVQCGFITLVPHPKNILTVLLKVLEANEARGRRRFVRAPGMPGRDVFNIKYNNRLFQGNIIDISLAGMACEFKESAPLLETETRLTEIQLKLRGTVTMVSGTLKGVRRDEEGHNLYVIMFDRESMSAAGIEHINDFVCRSLGDSLEKEREGRPEADHAEASPAPADDSATSGVESPDAIIETVSRELSDVEAFLEELDE